MRAIVRVVVGGGAVAALGSLAAAPACFPATQITLEITTNASCEAGLDTQIFVGARPLVDADPPAARAVGCAATEPRIGTLTVTPSGSRDARFRVEVIAGVGVEASSCRATGYARCIVARRSVTFREHVGATLPIFLSDRCIGIPCGDDETCDVGRCVRQDECGESGCPGEQGDGGAPVADASAPEIGAPDATVLDPTCGPEVETVLDGQAIVGHLSVDGPDFVYANAPTPAAGEVRRVPRVGGTPTVIRAVPGVTAVAVGRNALAFAADRADGTTLTRILGGQEVTYPPTAGRTTTSLAFADSAVVGFVSYPAGGTNAFAADAALEVSSAAMPGPVPELLVGGNGHFYGMTGGLTLLHYRVDGADAVLVDYAPIRPSQGDIALSGQSVFIATEAQGARGVHRIAISQITPVYLGTPFIPGVVPRSLAADATSLFFLDGASLTRVALATPGAPAALASVSASADRLALDDACVYWIDGGGSRILRRRK